MVIQNINVKILVAAVEKQLTVADCSCLLLIHMSHMIWVILIYTAFLFYSVIVQWALNNGRFQNELNGKLKLLYISSGPGRKYIMHIPRVEIWVSQLHHTDDEIYVKVSDDFHLKCPFWLCRNGSTQQYRFWNLDFCWSTIWFWLDQLMDPSEISCADLYRAKLFLNQNENMIRPPLWINGRHSAPMKFLFFNFIGSF